MRRLIRSLHKWFGLIGGLWILVLGFSGLMLDHRDDWGWAWRTQIPDRWLPAHTVEVLENRHITLAQVNPVDDRNWVVGGPAGIWQSRDGGGQWQRVAFESLERAPMVFSIVPDQTVAWERLWLATDDGLWQFDPGAGSAAQRAGLAGRYLTALDNGAEPGTLVAIENRSTILHWDTDDPQGARAISTADVKVHGLPDEVSWSRFVFDMHLGRSFMNRSWNMAMNDIGALAMMILAFTGFLAWVCKRRWRGGKGPSAKTRRSVFRWLYNAHAPVIGLIALFPLLYLSATGIVFDHRPEWMGALVRNKIERERLPDVYDFETLHEEISHVVAYPGDVEKLTVGTRLGVLTTVDSGANWVRETGRPLSPGFVWSLKRHSDTLFLGGLGGPSFSRALDDSAWTMVPGLMGMPSDATISDDVWYVISGPSMLVGDLASGVAETPFRLPELDRRPLMLLMFELHNGKIIASWFRFVLDAMAVCLILMVITGPILWWRRKWA